MRRKEERIAVARIITDLIKADNIIEEGEIQKFTALVKKYAITQDDLIAAQYITFADAVSSLQKLSLPKEEREEILNDMIDMSLADGSSVSREALLLMSLKYCLDDGQKTCSRLYSCDTRGTNISDLYIVYIESEKDKELNEELSDPWKFRSIVSELKLCGFDFIYVPRLVKEFTQMGKEHIANVIKYIEPEQEDKGAEIYEKLCHITTDGFCKDMLASKDKLGMEDLYDTCPALLINIGTSIVPFCNQNGERRVYTEFLKLDITDTVYDRIQEFITEYKRLVTTPLIPLSADSLTNQFKYFGFYRALFDLMVSTPKVVSRIVIHPWKHEIHFIDVKNTVVKLAPKLFCLYMLILRESIKRGGLNAHPTIAGSKKLNEKYKKIRSVLGVEGCADYDSNILSDRAKIEAKFKDSAHSVEHLELYYPVRNKEDDVFKVRINPDLVFIHNPEEEDLPFSEAGEWFA